ncbi:MAG: undecaprenyldiphospho-muramoylpentapeptide beta-N-acetylglucosaminyltransferase [Chloroflexi bacterium]|nr:undecaprenyldiphospho-muramoylpentapeptide beta-N-acetylglucosaminyltransferase [Chloroflexota bacterium]
MRILITAGGTGGHVYPALAVAQAFGASSAPGDIQILWIGSAGGMEAELVGRAGIQFAAVEGAGLHGMGMRALPNFFRLVAGFFQSLGLVARFRPDTLFVTGGFVAVPVALAAFLRCVPSLVYLPDLEPGLAVKWLSRLARKVAVTAEDSRAFFPNRKVVVTGYPVRDAMRAATRDRALATFNLDPALQTLIVFGGSRGARSLNRALIAGASDLLAHFQIIHVAGQLDWPGVSAARETLPESLKPRYHAFAYLHDEMAPALAAADLAVARAGASTLGELPLFGLPAILVPYPHAWRYQKVNADYLAARGAAVRLNDEDLAAKLVPTILGLMADRTRLAEMRARMRALARPDAAGAIANELRALAGVSP